MLNLEVGKIYSLDEGCSSLIKITKIIDKNTVQYYFLDETLPVFRTWQYKKFPLNTIREITKLEEELI